MESETSALPLPSAPYRGIEPFRFIDQPIFSARTDQVRKLVRLITIYRGIFFYGESGAGKSSLINAGLIPALRDEGFAPERVRVQPIAGHELVVERIALTDEGTPPFLPSRFAAPADKKTREPARVVLAVEEFVRCIGKAPMFPRQDGIATSGAVPVLIFDQFEELITLFEEAPDSREKFNQAREIQGRVVEMLLGLLGDPNLSIKLVLSFREDYLAKVSRRLAAAPQLGEQAFRLSFPPETVLRKIIRGPFERASIPAGHFTRRLSEPAFDALESSFKELSDTGTINLTEVQIACLALWENEEEEKAFLKERDRREAVRRLFGNYLDRALNRLEDKFRKPAITALTSLVTSSGTRNIVSEDDLLGNVVRDDHLTEPDAREVLKALSRTTRLVFRQTRGDSAFYEISSEFLIPWITEKRQAREQRRAIEQAGRQREAQLQEAQRIERQQNLEAEARAGRRFKRLAIALGVVLILTAAMALSAVWQSLRAHRESREAQDQRMRAQEQRMRAQDERNRADYERVRAQREATDASNQRARAEQALERITNGVRMKQAVLSGDLDKIDEFLRSKLANHSIHFTARKVDLGYKTPDGEIYRYSVSPVASTLPPDDAVAVVTYRLDHPTFKNPLLTTGPDRDFTASYDGWGCLRQVIVLIEYFNPERSPEIAEFDMCAALGWTEDAAKNEKRGKPAQKSRRRHNSTR